MYIFKVYMAFFFRSVHHNNWGRFCNSKTMITIYKTVYILAHAHESPGLLQTKEALFYNIWHNFILYFTICNKRKYLNALLSRLRNFPFCSFFLYCWQRQMLLPRGEFCKFRLLHVVKERGKIHFIFLNIKPLYFYQNWKIKELLFHAAYQKLHLQFLWSFDHLSHAITTSNPNLIATFFFKN